LAIAYGAKPFPSQLKQSGSGHPMKPLHEEYILSRQPAMGNVQQEN